MAGGVEIHLPENYFGAQKWALKILGLSLDPNLNILYKMFSYTLIIAMIIYTFSITPDLFKAQEHFDDFINNWLFGSGYVVVMVKMLTVRLNRSKLTKILNALQTGVFATDFERGGRLELIWMNDCVNLTKKQTIISTTVGFMTAASCLAAFNLVPKEEEEEQKLPFGMLSILTERFHYKAVLMYQSVVFGTAIVAFTVIDVVYSTLLAHIRVQCRILQNSIRRMIKNSYKSMIKEQPLETASGFATQSIEIPYKYLQRTLKKVVLHHMAILKLADDAEVMFNIPTLAVSIGMSLCLCFIMYHGSLYPLSDPLFLKDFLLLFTALLPLAVNAYWGSEVIFASQAIASACYDVDFVGRDVKFQKALILIIQRSQRPIKLTVGKFAPLSLVTMLGLCRISYSYFMLLRRVNEK